MRLFRFLFAIRTLLKERNTQAIEEQILTQLNGVEVIGDDTLLRLILEIFKNTQRTNYFLDNALITLKIHTNKINYPFRGIDNAAGVNNPRFKSEVQDWLVVRLRVG
jgi:NAD-specific glutamate dehydrogenase